MVIYEVNLTVAKEIQEKCYTWLVTHVAELLQIEGFISAEILQQTDNEDTGKVTFTIPYKLESMQALQYYFDHHAERMRALGTSVFPPEQFTAKRRIFELKESLSIKKSSCCG